MFAQVRHALTFGFPGPERVYGYQGMQYHRELLRDRQRIQAYQRAIAEQLAPGGVVVDLGGRIGILSLLAAQAGASQVYLIERNRSMAAVARQLAAENGYRERITVLDKEMGAVQLPRPADLLVSDWLNPWFGIGSNIFGLVMEARDRFLRPGGALVPMGAELFLAPVEAPYLTQELTFWENAVPGLKAHGCRELSANNCYIARVDPQGLLATERRIGVWDLLTSREEPFRVEAEFPLERSGGLDGLCGWFDVQMSPGVRQSTGPCAEPTTWFQSYLPLDPPARVARGDKLRVGLQMTWRRTTGSQAAAGVVVDWEAWLESAEPQHYHHSTLQGYPTFASLLKGGTRAESPAVG